MSQEEKKLFSIEPYFKESLILRRANDQIRNKSSSIIDFEQLIDKLLNK